MAKSPKVPKLKTYRTAIGFHDAYVAAPSRAAALRAWGSDKDLFARGAAEEVTDSALTAEALAAPGTVIKRLRATAAEQLAALPPKPSKRARGTEDDLPRETASPRTARKAEPPPPPKPKPSRTALDEAEAALAAARTRQSEALKALAEREAAFVRERRDLERTHASETRRLTRDRDEAAADHDEAMWRWRR